jgi:bifunctional UDP-N-acetylglucosamine pyrophosphorylase/glucosamine-1-phosphate N-acetyltransferase
VQAVPVEDILSINTRQQLADVDAIMQDRIQRHIREGGVTIVSPNNTYIEAGVNAGRDTVIHPFVYVGRDSNIGSDCVIGPYACVPAESLVREGSTVRGNVSNNGQS